MGEGGQIWLKCITGDLIVMIRDKNKIFERVENFHADLAWNYPVRVQIFFLHLRAEGCAEGATKGAIGFEEAALIPAEEEKPDEEEQDWD